MFVFGRTKRKGEAPVSTCSPPPKPTPMAVTHGVETLGAYEKLADELGFQPAQLLEEKLRRFLSGEGMQIYDYDQVDAYMAALAEKENKAWIWRPLREQDKPAGWHWNGRRTKEFHESRGHGSYRDEWNYRPYDKAVPIHILRQVKKIQDKFGKEVLFFVSDYAVPDPDPFIMVTALDVERIIFGVWDEPEFGTDIED